MKRLDIPLAPTFGDEKKEARQNKRQHNREARQNYRKDNPHDTVQPLRSGLVAGGAAFILKNLFGKKK
jgi:hypothetical protein